MQRDLYAVLEVPLVASDEQIKAAYRQLVRVHHPDANPQHREEAEVCIKQIIEAYGTLGDPEKRARYDAERRLASIENAERGHQATHHRAQGEPESLLGRVRWNLGVDSHEFAAKLGLADAVLLDMESRDAIPATPVQRRTFTNLCRRAAHKMEGEGRGTDASELLRDLDRKIAQRAVYR